MHKTAILKPRPAISTEIVLLYRLPQFYYTFNINNLLYKLCLNYLKLVTGILYI